MIRARRIGLLASFTATTAVLLALAFARVTSGAGASGRPDLAVSSVTASERAGLVRVTDVLRNVGAAAAPRSTVGYFLSQDRTRGGGDTRLGGRRSSALRAGGRSAGSATVSVPGSVGAGAYYLLACADDLHRIRESNERNNCLSTARPLRLSDRTPPLFAGLAKATTCIPGPAGGGRSTAYHLSWNPASDNATPASEIVYDIYLASAPGGEEFSRPTYNATAGATSFNTQQLPDNEAHYFVVRARDRAGNRETNKVERLGENLCL
ncbi:MAG: CARDB domain-containing protein [Thermoleophilia bacterium]